MNKADNHHAAKSGVRSEKTLKEYFSSVGHPLYKVKNELKKVALSHMRSLPVPESMQNLDSENKFKWFEHDGLVPSLKLMIESKYTEEKGTTEEKIFWDLEKIENGVYNNSENFDLWYIIWGKQAKKQPIYSFFQNKAKQKNLPVKVLRLSNIEELNEYITQRVEQLKETNEERNN